MTTPGILIGHRAFPFSSFPSPLKYNTPPKRGAEVKPSFVRSADRADIGRLKTFGALFDLELDLIAFIQIAVSFTDDGFVVHEHIFAIGTGNEAETFGSVELLDGSFFHGTHPFD